jgi:hypothetical protein
MRTNALWKQQGGCTAFRACNSSHQTSFAQPCALQSSHAGLNLLIARVHIRAMFQEELNHAGVATVGIRCGCPVNWSLLVAEHQRVSGSRGEREQAITLFELRIILNALTRRAGSHQPWQGEELPQQECLYFRQKHAEQCPSP